MVKNELNMRRMAWIYQKFTKDDLEMTLAHIIRAQLTWLLDDGPKYPNFTKNDAK